MVAHAPEITTTQTFAELLADMAEEYALATGSDSNEIRVELDTFSYADPVVLVRDPSTGREFHLTVRELD